jgi:serine/threonine protein kinase
MSPEQVEGKEADARSDIFALGAVLYEMVTGKRAFEGKTTASTIAAILAGEPPLISTVQPLSPSALEGTVKSCLAKDPDERLQTAHDVKLQLKWIAENASSSRQAAAFPPARKPWDRVAWRVAGLLCLLLLGGASAWWLRARETPSAMYFNSALPFPAAYVALSPDGRTLAMVAFSDPANKNVIWMHPVGGGVRPWCRARKARSIPSGRLTDALSDSSPTASLRPSTLPPEDRRKYWPTRLLAGEARGTRTG